MLRQQAGLPGRRRAGVCAVIARCLLRPLAQASVAGCKPPGLAILDLELFYRRVTTMSRAENKRPSDTRLAWVPRGLNLPATRHLLVRGALEWGNDIEVDLYDGPPQIGWPPESTWFGRIDMAARSSRVRADDLELTLVGVPAPRLPLRSS